MPSITSPQDVAQLGTILTVWAHPDDETFCAAGILACAVKNGQKVICVTATKGEAGVQDVIKWPPETLAETRAAELQAALGVLGVTEHHWLDYHDGECTTSPADRAVQQIKHFIDQYKPDSILTFGPDGLTGHHDHQCVSRWVDAACEQATTKPAVYHVVHTKEQYEEYFKDIDQKMDIFFNIEQPPITEPQECAVCVQLPEDITKLKYQALKVMPSQTAGMLEAFDETFMQQALSVEAFVRTQK